MPPLHGEITGDRYIATGAFNTTLNVKAGVVDQFTSTFRVIGQGQNNNLIGTARYQFVVNANGEVVVDQFDFSLKCL